jgi:hypothetical protein
MKVAIYDTTTGQILETRRSSAGTLPNLPGNCAWRPVPDECHPDTHMSDPMGITCAERPDMPVTISEQDGELVLDGLPEDAEVLFHGLRGKGLRRLALKPGENHHLFVECWPFKPLLRRIDKRLPKAEREEARRSRVEAALGQVKDPGTRAALRALAAALKD